MRRLSVDADECPPHVFGVTEADRVGEHIELANLAAFLVSDGAAYINGDAVVIDGSKMQSGGGGASTQSMLDWTDEQWEEIRLKKK